VANRLGRRWLGVAVLAVVVGCLAGCGGTEKRSSITQQRASVAGGAPETRTAHQFLPIYAGQVHALAAVTRTVLGRMMSEVSNGRYYRAGEWHAPTTVPGCWWCLDGAATAAAVLSDRAGPGASALATVAADTFSAAIAHEQLADGAFQSDGAPNAIATGFELVELGVTYLELQNSLPASTRSRWARAIEAAADYLMSSGAMTWYINGNIQLHQVEDMWLAWHITGSLRFRGAYESEWAFAVEPRQSRWKGFGLKITHTPTSSDGADGAGYLAEAGGGAPGFDPEYTMLQLDYATSLWVLTHERRYLRLMNLLFNQLRPLVSRADILDARDGTRRNDVLPLFSMGPVVLLDSGDRPDLRRFVSAQLRVVEGQYEKRSNYDNLNFYRGMSLWLSLPLLFAQWPHGIP
jgi:hypothetical protein